jgi:hypothetical protein
MNISAPGICTTMPVRTSTSVLYLQSPLKRTSPAVAGLRTNSTGINPRATTARAGTNPHNHSALEDVQGLEGEFYGNISSD